MEAAGRLWQRLSGPQERRLLEILSYGLVGMGALSLLLLRFVRMPYGRYSTRRFGCPVPARLAWALQELPSLLVPLGLSLFSGAARVSEWPNRVLLALFIGHYAHRKLCDTVFNQLSLNGETIERPWLICSPLTGCVFCFVCRLFSVNNTSPLAKREFDSWNQIGRLGDHESSTEHRQVLITYIMRLSKTQTLKNI